MAGSVIRRVGPATAQAHHLFDVVGLRSAGPTLHFPESNELAGRSEHSDVTFEFLSRTL